MSYISMVKESAERAKKNGLEPELTGIKRSDTVINRPQGNFRLFAVIRGKDFFFGISKRSPDDPDSAYTSLAIAVSRAVKYSAGEGFR